MSSIIRQIVLFYFGEGPKTAHPQNTIKIGFRQTHFLKTERNGHFWTNTQPEIPVIMFFLFLLVEQQKPQTFAETPIFIVFLQT